MSKRRKYNLNENYFNKIDSEDKAYFLGLLFADGYNYTYGNNKYVSLRLSVTDIDILEKFQLYIDSNYPIKIYKTSIKNPNHSDIASLQINSKIISNDLSSIGCIQNKSNIISFPSECNLPIYLRRHFIRGYFDGNGCVWEGKRKVMTVKDKFCKLGYRDKVIHNVKFTITGSVPIITGIQSVVIVDSILPKTMLNKYNKLNNSTSIEYSGRGNMKVFYDYIYKDSSVYMKRKKDKFESILNIS